MPEYVVNVAPDRLGLVDVVHPVGPGAGESARDGIGLAGSGQRVARQHLVFIVEDDLPAIHEDRVGIRGCLI